MNGVEAESHKENKLSAEAGISTSSSGMEADAHEEDKISDGAGTNSTSWSGMSSSSDGTGVEAEETTMPSKALISNSESGNGSTAIGALFHSSQSVGWLESGRAGDGLYKPSDVSHLDRILNASFIGSLSDLKYFLDRIFNTSLFMFECFISFNFIIYIIFILFLIINISVRSFYFHSVNVLTEQFFFSCSA